MVADQSHHTKFIPEFIKKQRDADADIFTGTIYSQNGSVYGWYLDLKLTSRVSNFLAGTLLAPQASDKTGSFRLYKKNMLGSCLMSVKSRENFFQMKIIVCAKYFGYSIEEVLITIVDRIFCESMVGAS